MKKILLLFIVVTLIITGCGKKNKDDVIKKFKNNVEKSKSYQLIGTMEINSDEDVFRYDLKAEYLHKDIDFYKVTLKNQTNNHEQIILKNNEGVYVVTPSLNKSFKFQSNWPSNSSQSYLLESIINDIKKDANVSFEEKDGYYIIKNKVNYPNNEELKYEKVYLDKGMTIKKVEVYNNKDNIRIKVELSDVNLKAKLDESEFELSKLIKDNECIDCNDNNEKNQKNEEKDSNKFNNQDNKNEKEIEKKEENENNLNETEDSENQNQETNQKSTTSIKDVIYPLYVPENTALKSKDVVSTENGERVILTFSGDNSFVLVEETISPSPEFEIIPVYGDPEIVNDSIGALSSNSLSWTSNNINYYITGSNLAREDLLSIATSMNNIGTVSAEK